MSQYDRSDRAVAHFHALRDLVRQKRFDEAASSLRELSDGDVEMARAVVQIRDEQDYDLICWSALSTGSLSLIQICTELGADPNCRCGADHILTKLILADSEHGLSSAEEIKYLVELGADPNSIAVGAGSYPLLHFAIKENRLRAAQALLESGADPLGKTGETGLDAAAVARRYNKRALDLVNQYLAKG